MQKGEIWWARLAEPIGRRPVLLLSRDKAIQVRQFVTVAHVTRTIRAIPAEVVLDESDGMPARCVVNADVLDTLSKALLVDRITMLSPQKLAAVHAAVRFALDLS